MRFLLAYVRPENEQRWRALADALTARKHRVELVDAHHDPLSRIASPLLGGAGRRRSAWASAQAALLRLKRPNLAYVELASKSWPLAATLMAVRARVAVELHESTEGDPLSEEITPVVLSRATSVVVTDPSLLPAHPSAELFEAGVSLSDIPSGTRDDAKRALGLIPELRLLVLLDPLTIDLPLEMILAAHRRLSGVGLLVAADGPQARLVEAATLIARPSSPILFNPEVDLRTAAAAADLGLDARGRGRALFAALGRRQVSFDGHTSLGERHGVRRADSSSPEALARCLDASLAEERASVLDPGAVDEARQRVSLRASAERLAAHLESLGAA